MNAKTGRHKGVPYTPFLGPRMNSKRVVGATLVVARGCA